MDDANNVVDASMRFYVRRCAAKAKRARLEHGAAEVEVEIDFLDAELRACMQTGVGFGEWDTAQQLEGEDDAYNDQT